MVQHKILKISSEDMDISGSNHSSDFVVSHNNEDGLQAVKSIIVKQVSFTNTFYNIASYNNTLTYNIAGIPSSISITEGQYSYEEFKTALETVGSGIGLSLTLNTINNRVLLGTTTAVEWLTYYQNNLMGEILGITTGSLSDVTSFTPPGIINLSGVTNIYIQSLSLSENNLVGTNNGSVLTIIPITVPYGAVEHYLSPHDSIDDVDSHSNRSGKNLQKISIRLMDGRGNLLNARGTHVTIILKIYY